MARPNNSTFLDTCNGKPSSHTPIWMMRQAGRYMPNYQKIRKKYTLLEIVRNPELACEVTLQPIEAFGFDAAILFSDILIPLEPMGCPFTFVKGEGPKILKPIRTEKDIQNLKPIDAGDELPHVGKAIEMINHELKSHGNIPLIGFCGAPFTLASYMIEGGPSKNYDITKSMMLTQPKLWHSFLKKITPVLISLLEHQIESGAKVIQVFDSWAGSLSQRHYEEYVMPYTQEILSTIQQNHPSISRIHFAVGSYHLFSSFKKLNANIYGCDWRTPLSTAREMLGPESILQGNLDPITLSTSKEVISTEIDQILKDNGNHPGFIFNLGHGILPNANMELVKYVVDEVHQRTQRKD